MIGVGRRVDFFTRMGFLFADVEIVGAACTVVGADEVDDAFRNMVLVRQLNAVGDVRNDDFSTLLVGEVVMRAIGSMLVLSEIHRVLYLSDVVIQSTRTGQLRVATNLIQHLFAQIGYLNGVLESAWSCGCQLTQQGAVGVAQFHQR